MAVNICRKSCWISSYLQGPQGPVAPISKQDGIRMTVRLLRGNTCPKNYPWHFPEEYDLHILLDRASIAWLQDQALNQFGDHLRSRLHIIGPLEGRKHGSGVPRSTLWLLSFGGVCGWARDMVMIRPANLEVISKRPISQHFKKSMMIRILADVIQIWVTISVHYTGLKLVRHTIMLSTCSDTFLRIESTLHFCHIWLGIDGSEEDRFVLGQGGISQEMRKWRRGWSYLVHTSIGK